MEQPRVDGGPGSDANPQAVEGWAAYTLADSLRSAVLLGNAAWQVVMILVIITSPEEIHYGVGVVAAHVAVIALALAARARRVPVWATVIAVDVVLLIDWAVADSIEGALCLAATWMFHLAQFQVALVLDRRQYRWLGPLGGIGVPIGIALLHPEGALSLVPAAVGGLGIRRAGRLAIPWLERFAQEVDDAIAVTWAQRREAAAARAGAAEAAEQVRTLHDTAINTLAAIASGGGSTRDRELVRRWCARDAEILVGFVEGAAPPPGSGIVDVAAECGLTIVRRGLDDHSIAELWSQLPDDVARRLEGGVREATRNVVKHASVDRLVLDVDVVAGELSVVIADDGVGFEGSPGQGAGLAQSIRGRAADAGIAVQVQSEPGRGTTVRFAFPLSGAVPPPGTEHASEPASDVVGDIEVIRSRTCWVTVAGIALVGIFIEAVGRPGVISLNYAMLGVVAGTGIVAWWWSRHHSLGRAATVLVTAAVPIIYLLSLEAVDFGAEGLVHWHSLAAAAPLVILLAKGTTRDFAIGTVALLATAGAATMVAARGGDADVAAIIPVGTAPALAVIGGWWVFHRTLARVGTRIAADQRAAASASVERVARDAAEAARERWRAAGLRSSLGLLQGLADGTLTPDDRAVQRRCAIEEAYLRQLMLLDPELLRMGDRFARALAVARERGVALTVRGGAVDVADADAAEMLGRVLAAVVRAAGPGEEVTVALLPLSNELRFSVVAAHASATAGVHRWSPVPGWRLSVDRFGDLGVIEVLGPRPRVHARS